MKRTYSEAQHMAAQLIHNGISLSSTVLTLRIVVPGVLTLRIVVLGVRIAVLTLKDRLYQCSNTD